MFEVLGLTVSRLVRLRFGPLALPRGLVRGRWAELGGAELQALSETVRRAGAPAAGGAARDTAAVVPAGSADDRDEDRDEDRDDDRYDRHFGEEDDDGDEDPADSIGNRALPEPEPEPSHLDDDEWQPRSANAHLEGITRTVRKGDGSQPGGGKRSAFARSKGGRGARAATFTGPMDSGRSGGAGAYGGFGPAGQPGSRNPQGQRDGKGRRGGPGGRGPAARGAGRDGQGPRGGPPAAPGQGRAGQPGKGGRRGGRSRGRSGGGGQGNA